MGNSASNSSPTSERTGIISKQSSLLRILSLDRVKSSHVSICSHPIEPSSSPPPVESSSPDDNEKDDKGMEEAAAVMKEEEVDGDIDEQDDGPSCEPQFTSSCLVVMRHGQRLDNIMDDWETTTSRPWDPPLTPHGHKQARQAGRRLKGRLGDRIMHIYSSPFKRCLQTAVDVAITSGVEQVTVSFGLSEMLSRIKSAPTAGRVSEWLWGAIDEEEDPLWSTAGWRKGGDMTINGIKIVGISCEKHMTVEGEKKRGEDNEEEEDGKVAEEEDEEGVEKEESVEKDEGVDPQCPETYFQACVRFDEEFRRLMDKVKANEAVLAVTHGDAVGRSVTMCEPGAVVYEVSNVGYCCLAWTGDDKFDLVAEHGVGYYKEGD